MLGCVRLSAEERNETAKTATTRYKFDGKRSESQRKKRQGRQSTPVPGKATGQRAKKRGVPNQNRPPRTTRSSFTANTASVTANDGTTRSSLAVSVGDPALTKQKPRAKSANQKGSPLSPENRRELRDPARKGVVDRGRPQGETWETDFGTAAAAVKPDKRVRNARQQTRNTTPKRNATKRSNNITLPQTGAVNRRKSQPSTGLDDESDMTWEALDTIDTKLDELTTKIADTILRSADDPVLKRQSQIRQRRILEIKELLKVLKENFQTSTF